MALLFSPRLTKFQEVVHGYYKSFINCVQPKGRKRERVMSDSRRPQAKRQMWRGSDSHFILVGKPKKHLFLRRLPGNALSSFREGYSGNETVTVISDKSMLTGTAKFLFSYY